MRSPTVKTLSFLLNLPRSLLNHSRTFVGADTSHNLKQRVLITLDHLANRDTFTQPTTELDMISRSLSPKTSLQTFLSVDSSYRSPVRVHSLNLISSLAASHYPHLSPHLPKILPSSLLRRLPNLDTAVHFACSVTRHQKGRRESCHTVNLASILVEGILQEHPPWCGHGSTVSGGPTLFISDDQLKLNFIVSACAVGVLIQRVESSIKFPICCQPITELL